MDLKKVGTPLRGIYVVRISWRVESNSAGGRLGKWARSASGTGQIDLDAIGMIGNDARKFVGAAHKGDPRPFDGAVSYGGDGRAKEGEGASEELIVDVDRLMAHPSAKHVVFGVTCYNNATALAKLAELRATVTSQNGVVVMDEMYSVEGAATASLVAKLAITPDGGALTQIDDTFNVPGSAKQWRELASAARDVIQRG